MTPRRDPDRLIHAFLMGGQTELADPVYDAVRDRIEETRQRAVIGPWRASDVNNFLKIGLAAAAVVVIAIIAINLLPGSPAPGGEPSASPSVSPSASGPTPSSSPAPPLTQSFTSTLDGFSMSYPEGWTTQAATEPWTDSTFPLEFGAPHAEFLYDPILTSDLFLTFEAPRPIPTQTHSAGGPPGRPPAFPPQPNLTGLIGPGLNR